MVTQSEILDKIVENGGVISSKELKKAYNLNEGSSHLSSRLKQLRKKEIIEKIEGPNRLVLYFLKDLSYLNIIKDEKTKKYVEFSLTTEEYAEYKNLMELYNIKNDKEFIMELVKKIK
ncbi:hypothetical protein [Methanococcus voltae]|uniref:hypothetical protein n=1 Tax=Methanococcus voltae TaxID=2188 RepID=UPI001AE5072C|nr:hypothetical protein [Methanococcus voltae]MBP2173117.1 Fe2+ or Zn2+ uptake regulation protein [Methanococcus voltae]